jgi:molybdate transport system substrate-binding protein
MCVGHERFGQAQSHPVLSVCSVFLSVCSVVTIGIAMGACTAPAPKTPPPALKVAAAADLAFAFKEIGTAFEKATGQPVSFSFGSTGLLAKQVAQGAPFNLFAAANVSFVDDVVKAGACDGSTQALYARGRIVLWSKKDTDVAPAASIADLADGRFVKIAIANPEHAPYGKAAMEAMATAGVLEKVKPKLVFGENVQQTLQFAQSGNVELAIVALSLATQSDGAYTLIDEAAHKPIDQALVVCGKGPEAEAAKKLVAFVSSDEGRRIMRRYGFLLPGESFSAAK